MYKPAATLAKTAVYAGLALGLTFGAGVAAVTPTLAYADVVMSNQATDITVPNATKVDPNNYQGEVLINNFYNKNYYTMPEDGSPVWHSNATKKGQFTAYFSMKSRDGKLSYSWPAAVQESDYNVRTFIDQTHADPNSLEYHLVYQNGSEDSFAGLMIGIAEKNHSMQIDDSRDLIVQSKSGTAYVPYLGVSYNKTKPASDFVASNKASEANYVYLPYKLLNKTQPIKANDTVEVIIPLVNKADAGTNEWVPDQTTITDWSAYETIVNGARTKNTYYKNDTFTAYPQYEWDKIQTMNFTPTYWYPDENRWVTDASEIEGLDPYYLGKIADAKPDTDPNGEELQSILHWSMNGLLYQDWIGYRPKNPTGTEDMHYFAATPATTDAKFVSKLPLIFPSHVVRIDLKGIEDKLTKFGWTVEFRGEDTTNSVPAYFYSYGPNDKGSGPQNLDTQTSYMRHVSVIPAMLRNAPQTYWTLDSTSAHDDHHMPENWTADQLLLHVYHADEPLKGSRNIDKLGDARWMQPYDAKAEVADGTIKVAYEYHAPGQTDENNMSVDKIDPNKAGVYKVTFTRIFGANTPISTYQYVYINEDAEETKTVTRTIVEHTPDGNVETTQPVELTRTVSTDAETGKKTYSDWSTATWDAHTAKAVDGWTANKNADEVTVTGDTKDARVDIYYTHPVSEEKTITRTIFVHQPDGQTPETKQVVTLKREGTETTTDEGKTTSWSEWNQGFWDAFPAPEFEGWEADKNVDAQTVTHETADAEEHIHYTKVDDTVNPETPDNGKTNNPDDTKIPETKNPGTTVKPEQSSKETKVTAATPKTGDVATAVAPVAATGLTALLGSLLARKRRKNN